MDPPWAYADGGNKHGGVDGHYASLPMERLLALADHVAPLAADESYCFLWTTHAFLRESFTVLDRLRFRYVLVVPWVKLAKGGTAFDPSSSLAFGSGHYFRHVTELLVFGVRGRRKPAARNVRALLLAPRREHSVKPAEQYALIERIAGPGFRGLELFARRGEAERPANWATWGDQGPAATAVPLPGWDPVPRRVKPVRRPL